MAWSQPPLQYMHWLKPSVHGPTLLEWAFESNNIILLPQWDTKMEQRFWSCKNAFNLLVFKSLFANVNACEFLYNEFIQLSLPLLNPFTSTNDHFLWIVRERTKTRAVAQITYAEKDFHSISDLIHSKKINCCVMEFYAVCS